MNLQFREQPSKTSDIILDQLKEVLSSNDLNQKIVAFHGDNTNCNFGGRNRRESNNLYTKFNSSFGKHLSSGLGCRADIVQNAIKTVIDCTMNIFLTWYIVLVHQTNKAFCFVLKRFSPLNHPKRAYFFTRARQMHSKVVDSSK